ncbi:hypothetical protein JW756_00770 [Candidatus Woesearchaeota archaeon]|nr:hypothetical protein [Candidatus Woesearchaeota archaeon]
MPEKNIGVVVKKSEKKVLKKVGIMSVAKLYTVLMAFFGLIGGFIMGLFTALMLLVAGPAAGVGGLGAGMGAIAIIVLPIIYGILGFIIYGVLGFIFGAIGAWLYNVVAGWVGGVELEFE